MPSPLARRHRRVSVLCSLVAVLTTAAFAIYRPSAFIRLDNAVYDVMLRSAPTSGRSDQIAIVDIDERSLATIGQWPWRRDVVAMLIERIRDAGASVVALDIVFAETDRSSPVVVSGESRTADTKRTTDEVLGATLQDGRVILGYGLIFDGRSSTQTPCVLHPLEVAVLESAQEGGGSPYFHATGAVCNLSMLARAAGRSGFLNAAPDADGILRRVPLIAEMNGRVYPGLALAAVATFTSTRDFTLRVSNVNDSVLSIGDRAVPIDGKSNMLLRYRGKKRTFPYVSAADVLNGSADAQTLGDRIVFVGTTALGTREVVATPLDTLFPGVEVQATVADNLLQLDSINRSTGGRIAEVAAVLVLGGVVAALVATTGILWGVVGSIVGAASLWLGARWLLSASGIFVSPLFPTVAIGSTLGVMALVTFMGERLRADRAGHETVVARRLMVQTLLSLTEVRDAETGRHSFRTERYTRLLAGQLATHPSFRDYLTRERIDLLSALAPLHDIGKVGVPDHILNKPGALTPEERAQIQTHPALGRQVILQAESRAGVRDDETLALAKDIVYTHHERWDGTGYPQGLRGADIPMAGRIMALVDVYDAAKTRTLYRTPLSHEEILKLVDNGKGAHFDPAVAEAFVMVAPQFNEIAEDAS